MLEHVQRALHLRFDWTHLYSVSARFFSISGHWLKARIQNNCANCNKIVIQWKKDGDEILFLIRIYIRGYIHVTDNA